MTLSPIRMLQAGERRRASTFNRPMEDMLTGSAYLADGSDFEGFLRPTSGVFSFSTNILTPYVSGTQRTIWSAQSSSDATKGPFNTVIGGSTFAGTRDDTRYSGYNMADGGGNALSTEPAFGFVIEQDYYDGSRHNLEAYLEWHDIGGSLGKRPIFWQFNRATGVMTSMEIRTAGTSFVDWSTGSTFANLNTTSFFLNGMASQTDNTQLVVGAQNGKFGTISLAGGLLIDPLGTSHWALRVGGVPILEMLDSSVCIGGEQNFQGTLSVQVPTARKDSDATLRLRMQTSQTTKMMRVLAADGSAVLMDLSVTGVMTLAGSLTTGAPAGSTAQAWKLGAISVTSPSAANRTVAIDVGGTVIFLAGRTTND